MSDENRRSDGGHVHDHMGKCPVEQEYFDAWEKGDTFPSTTDVKDFALGGRIAAHNIETMGKALAWLKKRIGA